MKVLPRSGNGCGPPKTLSYDVTQLGDLAAGSTLNRIHIPDRPCPGRRRGSGSCHSVAQ